MKKPHAKPVMLVLALIIATGAAMAYSAKDKPGVPTPPPLAAAADNVLALSGHLVQTHVL